MKQLLLLLVLTLVASTSVAQQQLYFSVGSQGGAPTAIEGPLDYVALRSLSCSQNDIRTVSEPLEASGDFKCESTDLYGNGDDGCIVIASNNGNYWTRQFAYTATDPLQLDWCVGLADDGDEITDILQETLDGIGGTTDLFVKMPTPAVTLRVDEVTSSVVDKFYIFENGVDTLKSVDTPTDPEGRMFDIGVLTGEAVFGTQEDRAYDQYNLNFKGHTEGDLGDGDDTQPEGLIHFAGNHSTATLFEFRANVFYPQNTGVMILGQQLAAGIDNVIIEGIFEQAGFYQTGSIDTIDVDASFSDPLGRTVGWDGTVGGDNCDALGRGQTKRYGFEVLQGTANSVIRGHVRLRYGGSGMFWGRMGQVGTASEPFTIEQRDWFKAEDGTELCTPSAGSDPYNIPGWKSDAFQHITDDGSAYISYTVDEYFGNNKNESLFWNQLDCGLGNSASAGVHYTVATGPNFDTYSWTGRPFKEIRLAMLNDCAGSEIVGNNNLYGASASEPGDSINVRIAHEDSVFSGTYHAILVDQGQQDAGQPATINAAYIGPVTVTSTDEGACSAAAYLCSAIYIDAAATNTALDRVVIDDEGVITANASFSCGAEGTVPAGTYEMTSNPDRRDVGATSNGDGTYTICSP